MHRSWRGLVAPLLVALLIAIASSIAGPGEARPRSSTPPERGIPPADARPVHEHVLVLYSPPRHAGVTLWEEEFQEAVATGAFPPIHLHTEYNLAASIAGGEEAELELRQLLQRKYGRLRLDVVVPVGHAALVFALRHRAALFGAVPIVFAAVVREAVPDVALGPHVTGVWLSPGWDGTLDVALRLQPHTRHVVLVSGTSDMDNAWATAARGQLARDEGSILITHLTGLSLDETLGRVAALPPGGVILLGPFLQDGTGRSFIGGEARGLIAAAGSVPVYAPLPTPGAVGGYVVSFGAHGAAAGRLASAVLRGERPPPVEGPAGRYVFDARALARWGLDERLVPRGGEVQHRETSLWERYRWHLLAVLAFVAAQSALIGGLLAQRVRRRHAQQALAERLRFERLLSELSTSFIALAPGALDDAITQGLRRIGKEIELDRVSLLALGAPGSPVRRTHVWSRAGLGPVTPIEPDAFPWITARLAQGRAVDIADVRALPEEAAVDRAGLVTRGVRSLAVVPLVVEETTVGALACSTRRARRDWRNVAERLALLGQVFANVRARQRFETALRDSHGRIRDLAGKLLQATEEERRRIAREIHDDLSQKIAALGLGVGVLEHQLHEVDPSVRRRIAQLHERISALGDHTRRLSHHLHPAALQLGGLAAGLREHCEEFRADTGIEVELALGPSLDALPPDVALCLYRVAQAALANVARHSGAGRVTVAAGIEDKAATLIVRDSGAGFEAAPDRPAHGLGLVSMTERARLMGGRVEVRSAPGKGTEVHALVPITGDATAERAS